MVAGIGLMLLASALSAWRSSAKQDQVASSTVSLQSAMLLTETLYRDICQLGVDQARREPLLISDKSLSFYKVKFEGPEMKLVPLKFSRVRSPKGNWFLKREEAGAKDKILGGAPCTDITFALIQDPTFGAKYLKVTMKVLEADLEPGPGRREPLAHSSIMRIPVPSMIGHPGLQAVMRIVPAGDLLPVDL